MQMPKPRCPGAELIERRATAREATPICRLGQRRADSLGYVSPARATRFKLVCLALAAVSLCPRQGIGNENSHETTSVGNGQAKCVREIGRSRSAVPKGLTIATIDISDETDRHVIVAAGTKTDYRGQVNTVLMGDGRTMFAVWSIGHGGMCGPMKKSTDGGLTWSDMLPTPENWRSVGSCPCIFRLTDGEGTERLFVFAGRPKHYQSMSLDGGETWTPMKWTGMYKPGGNTVVVPIDGGRRHLLLVQRGPQRDSTRVNHGLTVWQAVSSDGGLTWDDYRQVCAVPGADPCEPELIRSPDGRQLLCLMRENRRRFNSLMMTSDDEGRTWSKARELPVSLTGDRHMSCYGPDGRLVVVFRDRARNGPTYGHFVAWVGTYDDICRGQAGQYRVKLLHSYAGPDCGYSGLECLPDGTLVATTYVKYRPGPRKHSIVSVRFKLEEIDAKAGR